jgi:hypothetical protein
VLLWLASDWRIRSRLAVHDRGFQVTPSRKHDQNNQHALFSGAALVPILHSLLLRPVPSKHP